MFAPNPGEPPRPLAKIASGGELSRVMLAVKQALARTDRVLTYVFDEVDAGMGGGAAETIGRKLKKIAADRQVDRHHPPAAGGGLRGRPRPRHEDRRAGADARRHRGARRAASARGELARMLGGANPSAEAKAHAAEMLRRARAGEPARRARAQTADAPA